jgi:hypothetical protein
MRSIFIDFWRFPSAAMEDGDGVASIASHSIVTEHSKKAQVLLCSAMLCYALLCSCYACSDAPPCARAELARLKKILVWVTHALVGFFGSLRRGVVVRRDLATASIAQHSRRYRPRR